MVGCALRRDSGLIRFSKPPVFWVFFDFPQVGWWLFLGFLVLSFGVVVL